MMQIKLATLLGSKECSFSGVIVVQITVRSLFEGFSSHQLMTKVRHLLRKIIMSATWLYLKFSTLECREFNIVERVGGCCRCCLLRDCVFNTDRSVA